MYSFTFSPKATKQLAKLDKVIQKQIFTWVDNHFLNCENPRAFGKGLTANRSGKWRYRIGDYRMICDIKDNKLTVIAIEVEHRSKIY